MFYKFNFNSLCYMFRSKRGEESDENKSQKIKIKSEEENDDKSVYFFK